VDRAIEDVWNDLEGKDSDCSVDGRKAKEASDPTPKGDVMREALD